MSSYHLENIWAFIKIHRCKENPVSKCTRITPRVRKDLVLFICLSENKRKKHKNDFLHIKYVLYIGAVKYI